MGKMKKMKIYLDNCCYNRPFDDQTQERIHLESEAILTVLQRGQSGIYTIVGSDVLQLEIERMHDVVKKQQVKDLYKVSDTHILYTKEIKERAKEVRKQSKIKTFDSLHIASAEMGEVDVMLTTDDKLEKMSGKLDLKIRVMNPLKFAWEVI